jgi:hypothetical protein
VVGGFPGLQRRETGGTQGLGWKRGAGMSFLADAMSGLGGALLPVAAALLFEELTFGGLVRLLIAPWPGTRRDGARGRRSSTTRGRAEHNHTPNRETVCGDLQPNGLGGGK